MKFCSLTLGCKVNQYETQGIGSILASRGHVQAEPGEGCDVCIINTCAVTGESVRKSRQAISRLKRQEPGALIAVCGCLSQLDPSAAASLGADLIGGSGDRRGFALEIEKLYSSAQAQSVTGADGRADRRADGRIDGQTDERIDGQADGRVNEQTEVQADEQLIERPNDSVFEELPPGTAAGRTRALLKIQDGCDNYCTYCVIPYARGRARSLPIERVADQAMRLDEQGFREIVVTGIEISSYGKDLEGNPSLIDAIETIGRAAPHTRLRIGSLEPGVVTEAFCYALSGIRNICNHFHLSLQSGSDETLRRMGRRYDTAAVSAAISLLRRSFPDCGITADLIVGFPGETDAEFEQTLRFIKAAAFSNMHIFPFSPRSGTRAFDMPDQVIKGIKRERARLAAAQAAEAAKKFRRSQIGKTVEVLFERKRGAFWIGHSGNYIEVAVRDEVAKNSMHEVQITGVEEGITMGRVSAPRTPA